MIVATKDRLFAVLFALKQCRRVATRYAKLAANDLAFVQLASIRPWFALAVGLELLVGEHPDQDHGAHHREVE